VRVPSSDALVGRLVWPDDRSELGDDILAHLPLTMVRCHLPRACRASATIPHVGSVDGRIHAHSMSSVSTNVVLVGTILTTLRCDTLELLLGWCIRIPNLHYMVLLSDGSTMKALNDLFAYIACLEASQVISTCM